MTTTPITDQELIVHQFAPLDGPQESAAREQVRQTWLACRDQLGMTGHLDRLPGTAFPSPEAISHPPRDGVLAFQQGDVGVRQAVLRREHDTLNLSVALAPPAPEGRRRRPWPRLGPMGTAAPRQRQLDWTDYAALWAAASQPTGALLGEAHLFLAQAPPGPARRVGATEELGQAVDALLPYREDRPARWWREGITTTAGYALWDTGRVGDTAAAREIVVIAAAGQGEELSAWTWSDDTTAMPPFARYLMHAAKLRYEARLLASWHEANPRDQAVTPLLTELYAALKDDGLTPADAGSLRTLQVRLPQAERRLTERRRQMTTLRQTVAVVQRNLASQAGCATDDAARGMFASDQELAKYLDDQLESDLGYLEIRLTQVQTESEHVDKVLGQLSGRAIATIGQAGAPDVSRRVFVVHGRDDALVASFYDLLKAAGLHPLHWEQLVSHTGLTAPYLGDVVRNAPHVAQATLVLLSPDDIVEAHPDLHGESDRDYETERSGQARPNVLFEFGLAYMAYPERTVIVEVGRMRPFADLGGLNVIRFNGTRNAAERVLSRLKIAGCPVNMDVDWHNADRFENLTAYTRGPDSSPGD